MAAPVAALGFLGQAFLSGGRAGWAGTRAYMGQAAAGNIGNYNHVRDLGLSDAKAIVELPDLVTMSRVLGELGPKAHSKFRNNARKLGRPAQTEMRRSFGSIGIHGPLGAPRRPGRNYDKMSTDYTRAHLSFMRARVALNTAKGVDVNYKDRRSNKALQQLRASKDGTISVVRILVRAPALIVADMAGKSNKARKSVGDRTRPYETRLFGRQVVNREQGHEITFGRRRAITIWLEALDRQAHNSKQKEASRYAWPTMVKYMPKHKEGASRLFNETIAEMNRALGN